MTWIREASLTRFQQFLVGVLKCGPIPRHVGIIMDGNRRFAKKMQAESVFGHSRGFDKLSETIQWCNELGVKEVTVYAFSIENFKRTPREVDELMDLASEKFRNLLDEEEKLMNNGICIRVIGDMSLLRPELQQLMAKVMLMTKDNDKAFLNIAFAYTSRDEIVTSLKNIAGGFHENHITLNDITEALISQCLYLHSKPDLLLRTSGEVRFSDYLLWQISNSVVYFTDVLWPEFSFWNFAMCILRYQKSQYYFMNNLKYEELRCKPIVNSKRVEQFLKILDENKIVNLKNYASGLN